MAGNLLDAFQRIDKTKYVKKSVKFEGGSVSICGMFSSERVGTLVRINGTVNANVYRNLVEQHVIPSL